MYKDGLYVGYIYKLFNDCNSKLYIGQTIRTLKRRWEDHVSSAKSHARKSMIIYDAMRELGIDKFHMSLIEEVTTSSKEKLLELLNQKEIYYIKELNTIKPYGYNVTAGGGNISNSCKQKVDKYSLDGQYIESYDSIVDATYANSVNGNFGNILSCCQGMTNTAFGYVWRYHGQSFYYYDSRNISYKTVDQYSLDGIFIRTYKSLAEAARNIETFLKSGKPQTSCIHACCNGKRKKAHEYVWRYHGDAFDKYSLEKYHYGRKVNMYDKDGNYIQTFNTVREAANQLCATDSCVIHCCQHRANTQFCKGYRLFYANDLKQPNSNKIIPDTTVLDVGKSEYVSCNYHEGDRSRNR